MMHEGMKNMWSYQESWLVSGQMRDYWMIFHSL